MQTQENNVIQVVLLQASVRLLLSTEWQAWKANLAAVFHWPLFCDMTQGAEAL